MARLALALVLALVGPATAQTYRTYDNEVGGSTTYGSDGSTARSYPGIGGGATTYVTRPNGERETCRSYRGAAGSTTTTCR